ncbi:MAG: FMN-binding protein [Bacillota bacterium]
MGGGKKEIQVDLSNYGSIVALRRFETERILEVFKGKARSNEEEHIIQVVETEGYKGKIQLLVSIDAASDRIVNVVVLNHHETEEYGGYLTENWFLDRFKNKEIIKPLKVVKVIAESPDEIVAITGATKTSTAVVEGINTCFENYKRIKKGG